MRCFMFCRRRAAEQMLLDGKNLSVSSQDGGDEYSSEASELDNTKNVRSNFITCCSNFLLLYFLYDRTLSFVNNHNLLSYAF